MPIKKTIKYEADTGQAVKEIKKLGDEEQKVAKQREEDLEKQKKDQQEVTEGISFMGVSVGSLKASFVSMAKTARVAFGSVKAALISTGIGAIVVAFGALLTYFTKTERGAEKMRVAMGFLGGIMTKVTDTVAALGEWIVKAFTDPLGALRDLASAIKENIVNRFIGAANIVKGVAKIIQSALKFDWDGIKEGAAGMNDALFQMSTGLDPEKVKKFAEELVNTARAMADLRRRSNELQDSNRQLNVEFAQQRAELEQLKMISDDITKTEAERLAAAQEAFQKEQEMMDRRVENAEEALRIQQEEMALGENTEEDLDKEAELEIALANIKQESATKQIELNNKINSIKQETINKTNELIQKEKEAQKALDEYIKKKNEQRASTAKDFQTVLDRNLTDQEVAVKAIEKTYDDLMAKTRKALIDGVIEAGEAVKTISSLNREKNAEILASNNAFELKAEEERSKNLLQMKMWGYNIVEAKKEWTDMEIANFVEGEVKKREADAETLKMKMAGAQAGLSAAKGITDSVGMLAKEGSATAKAMALTGIIIDTAKGISGAIAAGAGVPFPGNLLAIATGVSSVLAGIANAKAVFAKTGEDPGGVDDVDIDTSRPDLTGSLVPNMMDIEQPTLGGQQTIQAYVVENDISNAQALQEELEIQSTL
tara:strand:- start:800 stop:2770 length:1971 start_codon:yes stop_codon:yes gene_type:complete